MTTATNADIVALHLACLADPDDDTARLVLADALDELGDQDVPCPYCAHYAADSNNPWGEPGYRPERDVASGRHEGGWSNCKTCNGGGPTDRGTPGVVRDDANVRRAEFVRVQIKLARWIDKNLCPECGDGWQMSIDNRGVGDSPSEDREMWCAKEHVWTPKLIQDRESALLASHGHRWRPKCPECNGNGKLAFNHPDDPPLYVPCPMCGSGKVCPGEFRCGLFVARVPLAEVGREVRYEWQPSDWAAEAARQFGCGFEANDRKPMDAQPDTWCWHDAREYRESQPDDIPGAIFDEIDLPLQLDGYAKFAKTEAGAVAALSRVVTRLVVKAART